MQLDHHDTISSPHHKRTPVDGADGAFDDKSDQQPGGNNSSATPATHAPESPSQVSPSVFQVGCPSSQVCPIWKYGKYFTHSTGVQDWIN
jgi:hypothetical protein